MSANFNPYHYWLGYPEYFVPRNYYEMLGISPQERDLNRIAHAADGLLMRVQNTPPGGYMMEWQQLLTNLQTAKMCLCNPSSKADYDAKMGFSQPPGGFGGASYGAPVQSAANYSGNVALPPGMSGGYGNAPPVPSGPSYSTPSAPPYAPSATPPYSPPSGASYSSPAAPPSANSGAGYEYSNQISSYMPNAGPGNAAPPPSAPPVQHSPAPMGMPAAPVSASSPPAEGAAPLFSGQPSGAPAAAGTSATMAVTRAYKKSQSRQRLVVFLLLVVILGLVGFIFSGKLFKNGEDGSLITVGTTHTGGPITVSENGGDDGAAPSTAGAPGGAGKSDKNGKNGKGETKVKPTGEAPSQNPAFRKLCAGIRADLGQQDVSSAREQLAELEKLASTPAEKEEFARLTALTESVEKFLDILADTMGQFKSGQVIHLKDENDERVSVVESKRGELTVKRQGKNETYKLDNLTPERVNFVVGRIKGKDADFNVHYGAYLAMDTSTDREAVRKKWLEAQAMGKDVSLLLPELEIPQGGEKVVVSRTTRKNAAAVAEDVERDDTEEEAGSVDVAVSDPAADENGDDAPVANGSEKISAATKKRPTAGGATVADKTVVGGNGAGTKTAVSTASNGKNGKNAGSAATDTAADDAKDEDPAADKKSEAGDTSEFKKLAQAARASIEWNDVEDAKQKLAKAQPLIRTPQDQAEWERLDALAEYMGDFLEWAGKAMGTLQSMEQITIAGEHIGVVESGQGHLVLRRSGKNVTYSVDSIDPVLADFLIGKQVEKSADNRVLYGTYLAMNPEGDRAKARKLWEEADALGFDTKFLLPELDVPHVNPSRRTGAGGGTRADGQSAARVSIPTEDERKAALETVKQLFAKDYAKELPVPQKDAFADKLLKQSSQKKYPAAQQYVMLQESARVATESQRYLTAYMALSETQQRFSENTYEQRKELITKADGAARGSLTAAEVAESALRLGAEAYEKQNTADAEKMLKIAQPLLKTAKKPHLNVAYSQLTQKITSDRVGR